MQVSLQHALAPTVFANLLTPHESTASPQICSLSCFSHLLRNMFLSQLNPMPTPYFTLCVLLLAAAGLGGAGWGSLSLLLMCC
jgi:hypothetical protein